MKTQLLCTFTRRNKLEETIKEILNTYEVAFGKIYILENLDNKRELICTYNANFNLKGDKLYNTVSIHRKKQTNTLYTINALNFVVSLLNDGIIDPNYEVDFSKFKNMLLTADENGLKKIPTKIFDIREI